MNMTVGSLEKWSHCRSRWAMNPAGFLNCSTICLAQA